MSGIVKGITGLFSGGGSDAAARESARQRELQQIAQLRQEQSARDSSAETAGRVGAARRVRGNRLLFSDESGGLASTLGGV